MVEIEIGVLRGNALTAELMIRQAQRKSPLGSDSERRPRSHQLDVHTDKARAKMGRAYPARPKSH